MARGRRRHDLGQSAELLAMIANTNRHRKTSRIWKANDFLPESLKTESDEPVMEGFITDLQIFLPPAERARLRKK